MSAEVSTGHALDWSVHLPLGIEEVFSFFSDAGNLHVLTPAELGFRILTPRPIEMGEGTLIDYALRLHGVPLSWRSRISSWRPPHRFVDEQVRGPYASWIHEHRFEEVDGGTVVTDAVRYRLPLHPLSLPVLPFVRVQLRRIFAFRESALRLHLLGASDDAGGGARRGLGHDGEPHVGAGGASR